MREKTGALIQFLGVIIGFILIVWGVVGGYNAYFGADGVVTSGVIFNTILHLIYAAVGVVVGVVCVIGGNLLKK